MIIHIYAAYSISRWTYLAIAEVTFITLFQPLFSGFCLAPDFKILRCSAERFYARWQEGAARLRQRRVLRANTIIAISRLLPRLRSAWLHIFAKPELIYAAHELCRRRLLVFSLSAFSPPLAPLFTRMLHTMLE